MIPRSELSRKTWLSLRFVNLFYVFFSNRRFFCASLAGRTTALAYCGPLGCSSWMGSKSRVQHFDKFASWWSNQPHWHYVLFFSKENSEGTKWNWILTWHPRWWQLKDVLNFHPENSGKWSILTSICFGRGWFNHQLDDSSRPPRKLAETSQFPKAQSGNGSRWELSWMPRCRLWGRQISSIFVRHFLWGFIEAAINWRSSKFSPFAPCFFHRIFLLVPVEAGWISIVCGHKNITVLQDI